MQTTMQELKMINTTTSNTFRSTRRRRLLSWKTAATTTLALAATASSFIAVVDAYQQPFKPNQGEKSRSNSITRKSTVMDVDLVLQENIRNRNKGRSDLERLYMLSADDGPVPRNNVILKGRLDNEDLNEISMGKQNKKRPSAVSSQTDELNLKSSTSPKLSSTSTTKVSTKGTTTFTSGGRSSTMPGFSVASDRQRAFKAGIRIVEERTGRRFVDSAEQRKKRKKQNGEAMYKNSASVPDSMVQFARQIHQESRITHKEEIELGEKTQEAIKLQNLYETLEAKLKREPTDEEWCAASGKINMEAIRQAIDEGIEAKNKLVTSNLRMVQSVVNTYIRNGLSAQYNAGDMMQDGIVALIRAAEKFEPDRGWKFSTYAMYWVRASVKRSQVYQSRPIPVPQRLYENHKRLKRIEREMTLATGRKPSSKELGATIGMSELQVNRCFTAMEQRCFSLDQELVNRNKPMKGDTSNDRLLDIIECKAVDNEHDQLKQVFLREDLIESLYRHLSAEEAEVLMLRYGLIEVSEEDKNFGSKRLATIAELSRTLGLKPDKVRRMINNSLKHLKTVAIDEYVAIEREMS